MTKEKQPSLACVAMAHATSLGDTRFIEDRAVLQANLSPHLCPCGCSQHAPFWLHCGDCWINIDTAHELDQIISLYRLDLPARLKDAGRLHVQHALLWEKENQVRALLDGGVDINMRDVHGCTALHAANKPTQVAFLARAGIDVDAVNAKGDTALHVAARHERVARRNPTVKQVPSAAVIQALLKAGADPWIRNHRGITAEAIAVGESKKLIRTAQRAITQAAALAAAPAPAARPRRRG